MVGSHRGLVRRFYTAVIIVSSNLTPTTCDKLDTYKG